MSASLVQPFLARVPVPLRPGFAAMIDLERRLAALIEQGRAEWPALAVDPERFVVFVAERLDDEQGPSEALDAVRGPDLYLTCACVSGSAAAIAAFDGRYMSEVDIALSRMRMSRAQVDEIKQLVRQRLFVSAGDSGKIRAYSGRGDLRRWVRSIAVRTCLNQIRKDKREIPMEEEQLIAGMSHSADDPELAYMKERYRNEFRAAFVQALGGLSDRQQNLLRHHHVDDLNIDEIGAIYHVHRVTAYRWLEKAREALVQQTQKLLRAQLQVEKRDFDSIMRLIRSQLHLSLVRYLGGGAPSSGDGASASDDDDDDGAAR